MIQSFENKRKNVFDGYTVYKLIQNALQRDLGK